MTDIKWTNDKIRLGDLQPWEHNPRQSTEKQAERIADSHRLFGQVETIAIGPGGEVLNGHQRLSAWLAEYGPDYEVDVRRASRILDDQERQALTVMLHAGAVGSWDWDSLANWDSGILQGFGFDEDLLKDWQRDTFALGDLLASENGKEPPPETPPQIDKAEELRQKWGVELGQMWVCGEHRIICGDCTDRAVVERVMGGEVAALSLTDPPYNVGVGYGKDVNDNKRNDEYKEFCVSWFTICQSASDRQAITPGYYNLALWSFIFGKPYHIGTWIKTNSMTRGCVSRFACYEPILFFGEKWKRERHNDIFDYPVSEQLMKGGESLTPFHPCPKPLPMWEDIITNYSEVGDIILDMFNGSGTAIIACENLNRRCRAIEISPAYVAVSLDRYFRHTGKQPQLLHT